MKKNIFLLAFAVSALFAGCTQKEDMALNGVEADKIHVTAVAGISEVPASKVSLGDAAEKISTTWTEGEVFSVLQGTASIAPAPFTQTGEISAEGKIASFEGDLSGTAADCYAFSPALSAETAAATAVEIAMTGQDGSLNGSHSYMWAKGTYEAGEPLNFGFKQLTAILKVNMTFPEGVTGPATGVTFVADEGLIAKATVDITGETPAVTATVSGNIALTGDIAIAENVATVYFNVLPSTIKNLRLVATVGRQQYIGLIRTACAPAASKAYNVNVQMAELNNYYVSTEGTGIGESFENAMSLESFLALVKANDDSDVTKANAAMLDGKKFCFAEGPYEIPCTAIEYSGQSKQIAYAIEGGYTSATEREGTTTFKRKDANSEALFTLTKWVDLSFDGIVFDGLYAISDKGKVRAFLLSRKDTDKEIITLRMKDCVVKNFNVSGGSTTDGKRGGAMRITYNSTVYLDNVEIFNNVANNRGGALFLSHGNSTAFMNRCLFYGNRTTAEDWGGTAINGASTSIVCMNNTTVIGDTGNDNSVKAIGTAGNSTINGDGHLFIVNSTIISNEKNAHGAFRMGTGSGRGAFLMNNLISKGKADMCIQATKSVTSKGFNAYNGTCGSGWSPLATDTDYSAITLPDASLTDGAYVWTVAESQESFATKAEVVAAVKAFGKDKGAFLQWLGEDAFGLDGRGVARNAEKMQPGAYDAGL